MHILKNICIRLGNRWQTSASHWLNYYQDEQKAALHLGNSPTMLHRHYKALVTRKESEEFFKLWVDR